MLVPGIALVIAGAVLSFYGYRVQKQELLAEPPPQQPSGVVMFDEKKQ